MVRWLGMVVWLLCPVVCYGGMVVCYGSVVKRRRSFFVRWFGMVRYGLVVVFQSCCGVRSHHSITSFQPTVDSSIPVVLFWLCALSCWLL